MTPHGSGWTQRAENFRFAFEARERAQELAGKTLGELYKFTRAPLTPAAALMRGEDLVPRDRRLTHASVTWGARTVRGRAEVRP